jgi:hypothetical protein
MPRLSPRTEKRETFTRLPWHPSLKARGRNASMDKKKQITGLSADEIRDSHIAAYARLFSCDQDEDPRIEAMKTDDTRYLSAAIYLLDRLEEIQEAKEIRQSPVILKVAGILTKAVSDAGVSRLGELAVLFPEDQQRIIQEAISSIVTHSAGQVQPAAALTDQRSSVGRPMADAEQQAPMDLAYRLGEAGRKRPFRKRYWRVRGYLARARAGPDTFHRCRQCAASSQENLVHDVLEPQKKWITGYSLHAADGAKNKKMDNRLFIVAAEHSVFIFTTR